MIVGSKVDDQCGDDVLFVLRLLTSVDVGFDTLRMFSITIGTKLVFVSSYNIKEKESNE